MANTLAEIVNFISCDYPIAHINLYKRLDIVTVISKYPLFNALLFSMS